MMLAPMRRGLAIAVIATAGAIVTGDVPAAQSEDSGALVVVLDMSGSMWGRIDGEMKITIAKSVVQELLREVPPGLRLGFVAYGHRRKGDCGDIEHIAAVGTEPAAIGEAVERLTARGRTPITAALREGVDAATAGDGAATVVVVSDGLETCAGDPCALAEQLRQENAELVVHTVGFGVSGDAVSQLQCVAEAGGGRYFHAADVASLRQALLAVRDAAASGSIVAEPAAAMPQAETVQSGRIRVAGPGTIVLQPAPWVQMPPYRWLLLDAETGEGKGASREETLRVMPGEYQIVWHQAEHGGQPVPMTEVVTVTSRERSEVPIATGLRLVLPEGWAAPYRWSLRRDDEEQPQARFAKSLEAQVTPAGIFRLIWRQAEHGASDVDMGEVTIESGKLNEHVLDSGLVLQLPDWLPQDFAPYYYRLLESDGTVRGSWRKIGPQLAPTGEYTLLLRQSEHGHGEVVWKSLSVPEHGILPVPLSSGVQFIPFEEDLDPPYRAYFIDLDSGQEYRWNGPRRGGWDPVLLPPGRYRLDWWQVEHGSERMTLLEEFEVPEGMLVEIEV